MYTNMTKLRHGQTHSAPPAPLCCDQSHLKGFPLPMHGPPLGLVVYLLLDAFFLQVGPSVRVEGISSEPVVQSVRQPVTRNQRSTERKCWLQLRPGVKQRAELSVCEASIATIHTHTHSPDTHLHCQHCQVDSL